MDEIYPQVLDLGILIYIEMEIKLPVYVSSIFGLRANSRRIVPLVVNPDT